MHTGEKNYEAKKYEKENYEEKKNIKGKMYQ
jgi:hypothetical protein